MSISDEEINNFELACKSCVDGDFRFEMTGASAKVGVAIIERLRAAEAVLAKLPLTADGVPVVPGRVFLKQDIYRTVQARFDILDLGDNWYHCHQVYSTEAAALAAQGKVRK